MNFFDIKIETERLYLVPIELSHADDGFTYMNAEVTKYMYPKPADDISETISWIKGSRKRMAEGSNIQLVILKKDKGEFLGCAGLHDVDGKTPELGVWTKKSSHGNGYGREAMTGLYNWACENIEFDYITYPVYKLNTASRKIPESLGGVIAREFKSVNQSGFGLDEVEYRIYPEKQEKIEAGGIKIKFYKPESFRRYLYVIIVSRHMDKWVFCRQKDRDTWEIPGGHIEPGEAADDAAERELIEETGAVKYSIRLVSDVAVKHDENDEFRFSRLYYAEIEELGPLPGYEIEEVKLTDTIPEKLTYSEIQPVLFEKVKAELGLNP